MQARNQEVEDWASEPVVHSSSPATEPCPKCGHSIVLRRRGVNPRAGGREGGWLGSVQREQVRQGCGGTCRSPRSKRSRASGPRTPDHGGTSAARPCREIGPALLTAKSPTNLLRFPEHPKRQPVSLARVDQPAAKPTLERAPDRIEFCRTPATGTPEPRTAAAVVARCPAMWTRCCTAGDSTFMCDR